MRWYTYNQGKQEREANLKDVELTQAELELNLYIIKAKFIFKKKPAKRKKSNRSKKPQG